jgi:uncharacterized phiE125 gp8 family phage protein
MMLVEVAPVPGSALPVQALKDHLRMGSGFAEDSLQDGLLEGFLRAALAAIESRTGKALFSRAFAWTVEDWRQGDRAVLPVAPVSAVSAVVTITAAGVETTVPVSGYRLVPDMQRPVLLAFSGTMPAIPQNGGARVEFTAGFAAAWTGLPPDLRQAVLLLAAHFYEYRQDTGLAEGCMPFGVTSLIERYRAVRMGFGA